MDGTAMRWEMKQNSIFKQFRRALCVSLIMGLAIAPTAHSQGAANAWISVIINMTLQYALTGAGGQELSSAGGEIIAIGLALPEIALCALVGVIRIQETNLMAADFANGIANDPRVDALDNAYQKLSSATVGECAGSQKDPQQITTAGDPNDKVGSRGVGMQQYISGATPLRYALFFSNELTATASAQKVIITDQLSAAGEDLATFNLGPISLPNQLVSPPPGPSDFSTTADLRPSNNILVAINTHLDMSTGLLTWTFQSLDPTTNQPTTDPTAGFLPPGANGSVFFTVMPKQGLATNTQVQNQATVVFDANAPISTPTWLNTLDNDAPISQVAVLPAIEYSLSFTVRWTATDVGSGIQDFTIFVSDNGGPFTAFETNVTSTSASFTGQTGHTYAFYSLARDLVGNVEAAKTAAEATTQVVLDSIPPITTATISAQPNAAGWNNSNVTVSLISVDNPGGSGVNQITYSVAGAQTIPTTTLSGSSASFTISAEGISTITFFGTDNAGNVEAANTLTIRLDKTPPTITGTRTPVANANGWNNSLVTVSFQCADVLSGLAAGSPPTSTVLSTQGAGQSVSGTCTDIAGNAVSASVQGINIDLTPPILTISANPPANANGWNNSDVTVSFAAVDTLSGVAVVNGPVTVTTEGAGRVVSGSATDLAGNLTTGSITINLDKTPPEAFNHFDPVVHDVVLFGRDSLSGVPPGPVAPLSVVPIQVDPDGDDMGVPDADDVRKELRTYQVLDLSGNSLTLVEKVKRNSHHISVKIVSLQYGQAAMITLPPNRESFEWELAKDGTLKELDQEVRVGQGNEAPRVDADFDAKPNQTVIRQDEPEPKTKTVKPGLALVRVATAAGTLSIEF
jgi:hypothetical protein